MPSLLKARGLNTYNNELNLPEGSLIVAENVVIDKNDTVEPRRGMGQYGDDFPASDDRAKQMMVYKNRILRHFDSTIQFDDGTGTFTAFDGTYSELEDGLRLKYAEANGNLYFTTSDGIKKISATSGDDFSSDVNYITSAGAPKGLDVQGTLTGSVGSFFTVDSQVAYRVVWGTKDNNNVLILGAPSERLVLANPAAGADSFVTITSTIPADVTSLDFFYQIYRSKLSVSETTIADDELNLVYEEGVTLTDISNGYITVADDVPESFREAGVPLYTNPISGSGILQANDKPPIAKDITTFRESTFYSNTKTIQRRQITLLGVSSFTAGVSKLVIGNDVDTTIYNFDTTEDIATRTVKISTAISVAEAIDETTKSLVHVINRDSDGLVYAYYLSGPDDLPGIMLLESRNLLDNEFDIGVVDSIGSSFNPTLSESKVISTLGTGATPLVTTTAAHGYVTGASIYINCETSTPEVHGKYTITVTDTDKFTFVPSDTITVAGSDGYVYAGDVFSDNEEKPNRLYFSKTGQPESVPLLNYVDVGSRDKEIKRIIALRDNLFVLKEDGAFIVTGSTAPFTNVSLLDSNSNISAPDTAAVLNNTIYCLTTQGIVEITDTGSGVISRKIEDRILDVTNSNFPNSGSISFGFNYDSDRAYFICLPTDSSDTTATQCFRYNHFTQTWTRFNHSSTCALVNPADDKIYMGDGENNIIRQERKNYDRTDYADLDFDLTIITDGITDSNYQLSSTTNSEIGDVLVQTQYITMSKFNRMLKKLDLDTGLTDADYYSSLMMVPGNDLYVKLGSLITKLDADDTGKTYTSSSPTTFLEANNDWDMIVDNLNDALSDAYFKDYKKITRTTEYEVIITAVNKTTNIVTVAIELPFFPGETVLYKGFESTIEWAPQDFGDPSVQKQISWGTLIFNQANFYSAELSYASDLSAVFDVIPFNMFGNGTFGSAPWGDFTWGGQGTDIPFRALIPRGKQRCRYISARFKHINARESFEILGLSLDMRPVSTRAYR